MAAIRVAHSSLKTLLVSSSIFTNFRSISHLGITSISITKPPLLSLSCYPRNLRMAHLVAKATLGLTLPANIDHPKISFAAKETDLLQWKGDILAVGVTETDMTKGGNSKFQNPILEKLDSKLGGLLSEVAVEEDFTGKAGQSTVIRVADLGPKRVSLIGLGKATGTSTSGFHAFGESVASVAKASQANNVAIALASSEGLTSELKLATASAIAKGTLLGTHEDNRFKSEAKKPFLKSVDFFGLGSGPELAKQFKYAEDVCSGVILGKELVNAPANVLTPEVLAEEAEKIAATYSDVFTAKILDTEQCKELKMGSYLGVAAASTNPPKFIHLCYKPPSGSVKTKLALVGKGLTFDSGGYNIKTGPAVLGAAKALGQIKPSGVEVHFIVAACENMISGTGMRPGDILTASNGKTIEVNNTDAEGRLTLADALVYACNQGVDKIVDLATLTGACVVALGPSIAGIFTPSDELSKEVVAASEVAGEKLWRLPMEESYWESMKSGVADMVNTGGRPGGSITAALFLKQFVDEKVQWMHIDMAGPVWSDKKKGATGFGIPTLVEWGVRGAIKLSLAFRLKAKVVLRTAPSASSKAPVRALENEERSNTNTISLFIRLANGQSHTEETANPSAAAVVTTPYHATNSDMAHVVTTPAHLAEFHHHTKSLFAAEEEKEWKGDILAVGVTEKDMTKGENSKFENPILEELDSMLGGLLLCNEKDFTGKAGESTGVCSINLGLGIKWIILVGLGNTTPPSTSDLCVFGESVASIAKASQANTVAIALASSQGFTSQLKLATASAIAKGIFLGTHEVNGFISDSKKLYLKSVDFFGLGNGPELEKKLKYTEDVCSGTLEEEAEKIAAAYSDCIALHIPGVAAASTNPPQLFDLHFKPPSGSVKAKLALVAFDSGAYNIETGPGFPIELMKFGMGGSAAVLGVAKALGQIKPSGVEVHCIVAAGENMISGTGMHPGFVSTGASNGKTIEVNTDSEGRVTLADALEYACSQGAGKIVSLETADGACVATLGPLVAGIFTDSDELCKEMVAASEVAGEKLCRLPMEDMINTSGREGGGSLFLKQVADEKVQWLHIDMTGPVWNTEKKAATGFATHSVVEWVLSKSSS
ncbi:hypothetical protein M8C21_001042 [Ambrosia artemisiifolia]|uniref:Cytosol aminopeptidase domain-containing protein n=1 Tax=Ambrosia artemisiifolia TaxID=4212 RepID=A0AAD5BUL2_AMBAR|nr:hypothetical protein M8C21_001042 [Ambrosia artemisiifolia]